MIAIKIRNDTCSSKFLIATSKNLQVGTSEWFLLFVWPFCSRCIHPKKHRVALVKVFLCQGKSINISNALLVLEKSPTHFWINEMPFNLVSWVFWPMESGFSSLAWTHSRRSEIQHKNITVSSLKRSSGGDWPLKELMQKENQYKMPLNGKKRIKIRICSSEIHTNRPGFVVVEKNINPSVLIHKPRKVCLHI